MNNFYDRKDRTLFVSMIHKSITDDDLYELLSRAGPIEKVIFKENQDGTPMHALVIFRNVESVVFSMIHILPMVRSSKLIELRPLRESSLHHSLTPSSQLSTAPLTEDMVAKELTQPSYLNYNSSVSPNWSRGNLLNSVHDKSPILHVDCKIGLKTAPNIYTNHLYANDSLSQNLSGAAGSSLHANYRHLEGPAHLNAYRSST
uniref:RRM domain-containing protein n=1 Tax=Haemonchus contortus TaxID=6289 RepID=A0A7I4YTX1_HAECO|nr:C. briggsae CBR-RNP-8.1 protein [Haemonchus contortus]